jgi:hypothetical protein
MSEGPAQLAPLFWQRNHPDRIKITVSGRRLKL